MDIDKRVQIDSFDKSISEIDSYQMNQKAFELQNILFGYCGINLKGEASNKKNNFKEIFGRIRKLPQKSVLL